MVDCALNQARSVLLTADRPDAAVPVLFMRLKSGQLWEDTETEEAAGPVSETTYNTHIEGGQVGVIGDGAKIEGGIHFGPTTHVTQTARDNATQIGTARDVTIKK
jgi:hypothetical protein